MLWKLLRVFVTLAKVVKGRLCKAMGPCLNKDHHPGSTIQAHGGRVQSCPAVLPSQTQLLGLRLYLLFNQWVCFSFVRRHKLIKVSIIGSSSGSRWTQRQETGRKFSKLLLLPFGRLWIKLSFMQMMLAPSRQDPHHALGRFVAESV